MQGELRFSQVRQTEFRLQADLESEFVFGRVVLGPCSAGYLPGEGLAEDIRPFIIEPVVQFFSTARRISSVKMELPYIFFDHPGRNHALTKAGDIRCSSVFFEFFSKRGQVIFLCHFNRQFIV